MPTDAPKIIHSLHTTALSFAHVSLFTLPNGKTIDLKTGYIPLLTNYTFEDKAAKGLRKRRPDAKLEPAVYITALEVVRDGKVALLSGPSGSGKTTFALYVSWRLAAENSVEKRKKVVRNEGGEVKEEEWDDEGAEPWYWKVRSREDLKGLVEETVPGLLEYRLGGSKAGTGSVVIVVDGVEEGGDDAQGLVTGLIGLVQKYEKVKILLLGRSDVCKSWVLPADVERHDLLPLLHITRKQAVRDLLRREAAEQGVGLGVAAETPALFSLAVEAQSYGEQAEVLLDAWLTVIAPGKTEADELAAQAFQQFERTTLSENKESSLLQTPHILSILVIQQLLAARHLSRLPTEKAVDLFHREPKIWEPIIRSQLARLGESQEAHVLVDKLIEGQNQYAQRGALLVSNFSIIESTQFRDRVSRLILQIVQQGALSTAERERAGRVLSRLGDPRDLESLVDVDAGTFTMGSDSHPNSQPPFETTLGKYRIGAYPVVNRDYSTFVSETGRIWYSPAWDVPEKQNVPATDLTWHDANAYCAWLTKRWRASGRINPDEQARLPTEPEWERAARGNLQEVVRGEPLYPWGTTWHNDAANGEESGLNAPCSVGLFPRGRSPYGGFDMAGQVWEWCSTLWGEDMSTPSFTYPYQADDGRETEKAPEKIRRVLRGGCFSSGKLKATCVYRGSLEPAGFWRGNGFRVVVARTGV